MQFLKKTLTGDTRTSPSLRLIIVVSQIVVAQCQSRDGVVAPSRSASTDSAVRAKVP